METEIKSLESKLGQFVELCQRLREDNQELRQQLAASVDQSRQLEEKINSAATRLETLLSQIPGEDEV